MDIVNKSSKIFVKYVSLCFARYKTMEQNGRVFASPRLAIMQMVRQ